VGFSYVLDFSYACFVSIGAHLVCALCTAPKTETVDMGKQRGDVVVHKSLKISGQIVY